MSRQVTFFIRLFVEFLKKRKIFILFLTSNWTSTVIFLEDFIIIIVLKTDKHSYSASLKWAREKKNGIPVVRFRWKEDFLFCSLKDLYQISINFENEQMERLQKHE